MTHTEEAKLLKSIASKDAEIATVTAERDRLRECFGSKARETLCLTVQLLNGWHEDGTAWSKHDTDVLELVLELQAIIEALATPAMPTKEEPAKPSPPTPPEGYEIYEPEIVEEGSLMWRTSKNGLWDKSQNIGVRAAVGVTYARPIKPTPTQASIGICDKCGETVAIARLTLGNPLSICEDCLMLPQTESVVDTPKRIGYDYTIYFGGGIGPDVWDKEASISAVDIHDAVSQARRFEEDSGAWVFMVSQEDYPIPTRQKLEAKIHALQLELQEHEDQLAAARREVEELKEENRKLTKSEIDRVRHINRLASWAQQDPSGPWEKLEIQRWVLDELSQALGRSPKEAKWVPDKWAPDIIKENDTLRHEVDELKRHHKDAITALGKMDGIMMENARLRQRDAHVRQELEKVKAEIADMEKYFENPTLSAIFSTLNKRITALLA